jgi:hypothetical protein
MNQKRKEIDYSCDPGITFIKQQSNYQDNQRETMIKSNGKFDNSIKITDRATIECANLMYGRIDRPKSFSPPMSISINSF